MKTDTTLAQNVTVSVLTLWWLRRTVVTQLRLSPLPLGPNTWIVVLCIVWWLCITVLQGIDDVSARVLPVLVGLELSFGAVLTGYCICLPIIGWMRRKAMTLYRGIVQLLGWLSTLAATVLLVGIIFEGINAVQLSLALTLSYFQYVCTMTLRSEERYGFLGSTYQVPLTLIVAVLIGSVYFPGVSNTSIYLWEFVGTIFFLVFTVIIELLYMLQSTPERRTPSYEQILEQQEK